MYTHLYIIFIYYKPIDTRQGVQKTGEKREVSESQVYIGFAIR